MGHGYQRLDAVLLTLVEHRVVESQPFLIGNFIIPIWENAGPCNGHAVHFKPHLPKQPDIFLIMMIKITGMTFRIVYLILRMGHGLLNVGRGNGIMRLIIGHIRVKTRPCAVRHGPAFASCPPAAFHLIGSRGAAP